MKVTEHNVLLIAGQRLNRPRDRAARPGSARRMGSGCMANAKRLAGLGLPTAEDIAPLVLFLCSDGASKITGQVISVNGGLNA